MSGIIPTAEKVLLSLMLWFFLLFPLSGWGKPEAEPEKPRNPEWVLAVTAFDVSGLSPSRQVVGDLLMKNLIDRLNTIAYRIRVSPEYTFYQDYAWSKDRQTAAKNLAIKKGERDLLLFKGEPSWKYQKELKKIEEDIQKLEKTLQELDDAPPLIAEEPVFKLTESAQSGTFPPPPSPAGAYQFCLNQKADAFLTGSITEFHGRLYIALRLYTLYNQSFQYEDDVIFSLENTQQGIDALAARVVSAVSGAEPASILIHGTPEEAVILLDGSFAGRGETGPLEHPPGTLTLESFADEYQGITMPLELNPGELAELYLNLQPLSKEALGITVPDESAQVYQGALYLGQTPLEQEFPAKQSLFFHVETPEGKTASVIRKQGSPGGSLFLHTAIPSTAKEGKVAKARRNYYGAWARFWVALPTAFLLQGISDAQVRGYNSSKNPDLYQSAQNGYYLSVGAWVLFGLVTAEVLFRAGMYIYAAWNNADPLVGTTPK